MHVILVMQALNMLLHYNIDRPKASNLSQELLSAEQLQGSRVFKYANVRVKLQSTQHVERVRFMKCS